MSGQDCYDILASVNNEIEDVLEKVELGKITPGEGLKKFKEFFEKETKDYNGEV